MQNLFYGLGFVFHKAILPGTLRSTENFLPINKVNIIKAPNILRAARDNNVEKITYASSSIHGDFSALAKFTSGTLMSLNYDKAQT